MKGATLDKVELVYKLGKGGHGGYGQYLVHYTNRTCLVWDDKLQVHKYPEQYLRIYAVDEMDAAVKGMAKLKSLHGANNVRFGAEDGSTD